MRIKNCPVCNETLGTLDWTWRKGIEIHAHCIEKFDEDPVEYGASANALERWDESQSNVSKSITPVSQTLGVYTRKLLNRTGEVVKEASVRTIVFAKNAAKNSKEVWLEADKRVGTIEEIKSEEDAYEYAAREIEEGTHKKGLWAKAFSDADGDENRQAALYIKYRAEQLIKFLEDLQ